MKIQKSTKQKSDIPTASMPDIIFMLLIFFMVATVMKEYDGINVLVPKAQAIEKLESRRQTAYIWASKQGDICIDDRFYRMSDVAPLVYSKLLKEPKLTISLHSDTESQMKLISDLHTQLREASALKLSYFAKRKGGN